MALIQADLKAGLKVGIQAWLSDYVTTTQETMTQEEGISIFAEKLAEVVSAEVFKFVKTGQPIVAGNTGIII